MRKTLTLSAVVILAFLSVAAIKFFTDYPNSVPVGSDFFVLQRNQSYINASRDQVKNDWFTSPVFTGNGLIGGNWSIGGVAYGNGAGLTNVPGISGNFFAATNGIGQNPTFYGGGAFFGTYLFQEVDATSFFPTNLFTGDTNYDLLGTDGDGKLKKAIPVAGTNLFLVAGNNITFTTNGDGSITIATSGSVNIQTITNTTLYTTNAYMTTVYISTNYTTNFNFVTGKGNTLIVTNVSINGTLTNSGVAASSAVITTASQVETNAVNAVGAFTNSATGPPSFGLIANALLQNSSITVQGSAVALGGSTLSAGASPFFNSVNFTNSGYSLPTNNVGGAAFVFGGPGTASTLYDTNITAATTLKLFDITACGATAGGFKLYATCSGGTDRILTFPDGCSGAGLGTPPAVTITNGKAAFFDVIYKPGATPVTNVFWSPVY